MKVKIDTKEKFNVLSFEDEILSANMTEELNNLLLEYLKSDKRNIVIKMGGVNKIDEIVAHSMLGIQRKFYAAYASFVICELRPIVEEHFKKLKIFELLNATPTESEAWDIVQLEEIERELLE